jgi:hypothetical protein
MAQDQGIRYQIFEDNESEISFKPIQNVSTPTNNLVVPTFKIPDNNKEIQDKLNPQKIESTPQDYDIMAKIKNFIDEKKPSLTILTPCYNSTVYVSYMESLIQTFAMCKDIGLQMKVHFCRNDSLVSRARNNLIAKAMADPKTTHMLFIDADITWDPSDILKLLIGDKGVIGGIYPIKQYKWDNLSEPEFMSTLMKRKQKSQLADFVSDQDFLKTNMVKYNVNYESSVLNVTNNLAKVKHLATGFMMIKREVIETMCRGFPNTKYVDDVGFLHGKENDFAYALFDCGVEEGHYFSEDWMFCHRWSKMGGGVYIDVTINLDHTGIETYKGSYISSVL